MRGLSDKFIQDLQSGELKGFLSAVQNDDTLCLEIRDNYVNIYYRGGNLCRIVTQNVGYSMEFDERYAKTEENIKLIESKGNWKYDEWVVNIPALKAVMDKNGPPSVEKEFQQLILRENNNSPISNSTDYFITDIEYADSENSSRFDMVAVKWPSTSAERKKKKNHRLTFIEVKYGDGALSGRAGIFGHIQDMVRFLSETDRLYDLCNEMKAVFNQKVELGLLPQKPGKIESISTERPEFILLVANHEPDSTVFMRELKRVYTSDEYKILCGQCDLKIATASPMGYGLYESCMIPIGKYLGEQV